MPSPVYVIASASGVEDRRTNLVSIFNVIERVTITKRKEIPQSQAERSGDVFARKTGQESGGSLNGFRIVAVWMLEPTDPPEGEFDVEIRFLAPPRDRELHGIRDKLKYTKGALFVRMVADIEGVPPADGSGVLWIQAILIDVKTGRRVMQKYPMVVEIVDELN